jgi:hypothetical protein
METDNPDPQDAAEPGPVYLSNRDPDDETDVAEVDDGADRIAA